MNVTLDKQENCRATLKFTVPAAEVAAVRAKTLRQFASQMSVPGFRPGKAPVSVVEKRLGGELNSRVVQEVFEPAYQKAVKDEGLDILAYGNPAMDVGESGDISFTVPLELTPQFKLPLYKGLKLNVTKNEVNEASVESWLENARASHASYEDVSRGAQMKDFITIDYKGSFEGQPLKEVLEAGNHYMAENDNFPAVMAEESFVPGFCEQLLGAKAGETREIKVTMAEDAGAVAGKEVLYSVTVKKLQEPILPELNDEFAEKLSGGGNLAKVREVLLDRLTREAAAKLDQDTRVAAVEALRGAVEMEIPESALRDAASRRANELVQANLQQGLDQETIKTHFGEIQEAAIAQAQLDVRDQFILQEIAKVEGIKVSNEELSRRVTYMAQAARKEIKQYVNSLKKNNQVGPLQFQMILEKAVQVVVDNAQITYNEA